MDRRKKCAKMLPRIYIYLHPGFSMTGWSRWPSSHWISLLVVVPPPPPLVPPLTSTRSFAFCGVRSAAFWLWHVNVVLSWSLRGITLSTDFTVYKGPSSNNSLVVFMPLCSTFPSPSIHVICNYATINVIYERSISIAPSRIYYLFIYLTGRVF